MPPLSDRSMLSPKRPPAPTWLGLGWLGLRLGLGLGSGLGLESGLGSGLGLGLGFAAPTTNEAQSDRMK